jgi:gamma-glutamyl-gamma-aminobutyrate hydrolase PuuD
MTTYTSLFDLTGKGSTRYWLNHEGFTEVQRTEDADIIVFNGGVDIATSIYGERCVYSDGGYHRSDRDRIEIDIFDRYRDNGKLLLGICRGAQLLNCLNGGSLWQDVDGHNVNHKMIVLKTKEVINITSTHHQMMRPFWPEAEILGISAESTHKWAEHDKFPQKSWPDDYQDTEIVWYPKTRALCIQGHPEYVVRSRYAQFCLGLIAEKMKHCVD